MMNNFGQLNAGELATLETKQLNNNGYIAAKHLMLQGEKLLNSSTLLGIENLNLTLSGDICNNGKLLAPGISKFTAAKFKNHGF